MKAKAEIVADVMERVLSDAINSVIVGTLNREDMESLKRSKTYIVNSFRSRLAHPYTMLELQDTFDWSPRKVGKQK